VEISDKLSSPSLLRDDGIGNQMNTRRREKEGITDRETRRVGQAIPPCSKLLTQAILHPVHYVNAERGSPHGTEPDDLMLHSGKPPCPSAGRPLQQEEIWKMGRDQGEEVVTMCPGRKESTKLYSY